MDYSPKEIGEVIAYGGAVLYAFFKIFQNIYKTIKDILDKKPDKNNSTVTVNVGNTIESTPEEVVLPQALGQLARILLEQSSLFRIIGEIKNSTIRDQMDYFDKYLDLFIIKINNVMLELMAEAGIEDYNFGTYFSNFENMIEAGTARIKNRYRQMCKENHFTKYSPIEFRDMQKSNAELMSGITSTLLRKNYPQRKFIKNFKRIYELKEDMECVIVTCLSQARDVAEKKEKRVRELVTVFESKVEKLTNEEYKLNLYEDDM